MGDYDVNRIQDPKTQSKYWVFTHNNYSEEDVVMLLALTVPEDSRVSYIGFGREVAASGTPHLQGYLELRKRARLAGVKRLLRPLAPHLESRRGTQEQAITYCSKENPMEFSGLLSDSAQGQRTDLEDACDAIKEGATLRELWHDHTPVMVKFSRGLRAAKRALEPISDRPILSGPWPVTIPDQIRSLVIWGSSGVGKTEFARFLLPGALFVRHMDDLAHFDPDDHVGIIFDDMSFLHTPRSAQIHLLDWDYPSSIHIRYQVAEIPAHTPKVFLCNDARGAIFLLEDLAISRRVEILHFRLPNEPPFEEPNLNYI